MRRTRRGAGGVAFGLVLWLSTAVAALAASNPQGVAVIIGNRTYQDQVPEVSFAHRDAQAMTQYVVDVLGFKEENLIYLRDASKAELEAVFGNERNHQGRLWRYLDPAGGSDVVVYYSGHGVPGTADGAAYLLPTDADPNQPEINGYPLDLLYRNLSKLQARSISVFLDACFSGGSPGGTLVRSASPVFVKAEPPQAAQQLSVVAAAGANQLASWDDQKKQGLFTEVLLQAVYGEADKPPYGNGDGKVTVAEIGEFVKANVSRSARRQFGRVQEPQIQGRTDVVLSVFPPGRPPPRPSLAAPAPPRPSVAAPPPATVPPQPAPQPTVVPVPPPSPSPQIPQVILPGIWRSERGLWAIYDDRSYTLFDGNRITDQGSYLIQGGTLALQSASGQRASYGIQVQSNAFNLRDQSGQPLSFGLLLPPPNFGPGPPPLPPPPNLSGVWRGGYVCGQGPTGLRLSITQSQGNLLDAVLDFYPLPSNPQVLRGTYRMRGVYSPKTRQVLLQATQWINQAPNYGMVDLIGAIAPHSRGIFGIVPAPGCVNFEVTLEGR